MVTAVKTLVVWNGKQQSAVNLIGDVIDILDGDIDISDEMKRLGWWTCVKVSGDPTQLMGFLFNHPGTQLRTHRIDLNSVADINTFESLYSASIRSELPTSPITFGLPYNELG